MVGKRREGEETNELCVSKMHVLFSCLSYLSFIHLFAISRPHFAITRIPPPLPPRLFFAFFPRLFFLRFVLVLLFSFSLCVCLHVQDFVFESKKENLHYFH